MIVALGATGPGFDSPLAPFCLRWAVRAHAQRPELSRAPKPGEPRAWAGICKKTEDCGLAAGHRGQCKVFDNLEWCSESYEVESILDQHVCDLDHTAEHFKVSGAEGRYCYRNLNATTRAAAEAAASRARRAGGAAVAAFRSSRGRGE